MKLLTLFITILISYNSYGQGCTPTFSNSMISVCAEQLPFTWNGTSYGVAGSYSKTFTNYLGCDSMATLNLTVLNSSTSAIAVTVCPVQLPYHWNGLEITAEGTYSKTLLNYLGCDSAATLLFSLAPIFSDTTKASICINNFPYTWNGKLYNTAGIYKTVLTSQYGCDSTAVLILTVSDEWNGLTSTFWEDPSNWSCSVVPNELTDVIINSGTVVLNSNATVRSLIIKPEAKLTVNADFKLIILH